MTEKETRSAERAGVEHSGRRVEKEQVVSASPERVWRALADPEHLARWFVDRATGPVEEGGTYTWFWDEAGFEVPNEVVIAEPPTRLELKTAMPWGGARVLEVRIAAEGGETRVRLVDSGFREGSDWDEEYEGVDSGWELALAMMKHYVEHHFGEPRTELMVERPASYDHEELPAQFSTAGALSGWLAETGEPPREVGDRFRLELQGGGTMTGRLLARTRYEASWSWEEMDAVLEVKPFGHRPGERVVVLRLSGWAMDDARRGRLETWIEAATERLAEAVTG